MEFNVINLWHVASLPGKAVIVILAIMGVYMIAIGIERLLTFMRAQNRSMEFVLNLEQKLRDRDVKAALSGLLSPTMRENFLGYATIREVFNITKVGKVAGCMVTEGTVKRGAKVRLLRDNVVIHEGSLKTLKRFKDEVREVKEGFECGMAFENYDNIEKGDIIECFEVEEVARALA